MSLARTALRLAALEALAPHAQIVAAEPVWPTFAAGQVYDTQMSPVALTAYNASLPVISVSIDETKTDPYVTNNDASLDGDGREMATLAFEIMVPVRLVDEQGNAFDGVGPTDAMAKAMLDLIEDQILQRLGDARMNGPLRHVLRSVAAIESRPYADPDTDVHLSASRLELTCHIAQRSRWPAVLPEAPQPFDYLPEPLASVARELPEGGYAFQVATTLGALIGRPALFPALNEIRLAANLARASGDAPAGPPDASGDAPSGDLGGTITF